MYQRVVAGIALAAGAAVYFLSTRKRVKSLAHLDGYVSDPMPAFFHVLAALPKSVRVWMAIKMSAPRREHMDERDFGKPNAQVYEFLELVPGKVWRVAHKFQGEGVKMGKALGLKINDELKQKTLAKVPDDMKERVKEDLEKQDVIFNKISEADGEKGGYFKAGVVEKHFSIVAKLSGGGVLLYAPPRLHQDLVDWLEQIGPVQYIVLGSNAHTTCIPGAMKRFPEAKVVGPTICEGKVKEVGGRRFAVRSDLPDELASLNATLEREGARVHHVTGSTVDEALVAVHGVLCECDLLYTHSDGQRQCYGSAEWRRDQSLFGPRFLFYGNILDSYNKFIPTYRFMIMDTACPFPYVAGTDPAPDCCRQAASALRSVLASSGWERVASVHNPLILSRPDFVAAIDLSWRWLDPDGQPLA